MSEAGFDSRDHWMRRAGPFYPLLVAGQQQTRLPLASSLEPNEEDLTRSHAWLPVAGLVVGCGLAGAAMLLLETALVPTVVAALVIALGVFATGGWFEIGVARGAASLLRTESAETSAVTVSVTLVLLVLVKTAALLGTSPGAWVGALVASHVLGRWALLVALKLPKLGNPLALVRKKTATEEAEPQIDAESDEHVGPTWIAAGVATLVSALGAILAGHGTAALAFVFALAIGWIGGILAARAEPDTPSLGTLAATGALVELATLLLFAATSPAI